MSDRRNSKSMARISLEEMTLPGETSPSALIVTPQGQTPKALVVSIHGISRNAHEHAVNVGRTAARQGWATLAPIFDRDRYPDYQRLGGQNGRKRSDLALDAIVDAAFDYIGIKARPFFLAGYSGGAQFAHRYALLYPHRVRALGLSAAGWYTTLDPKIPFPRGIKPIKRLEQRSVNLDAFLRIPKHVSVGELDNLRDPAFRTTPFLDEAQGKTRVDRAKNWLRHVDDAAKAHEIKACREFQLLNHTDHDFTNAVDPEKGDLAQKWITFFAAARGAPNMCRI